MQFGGVVGAIGVVQAVPEFAELALAIPGYARAGFTGVGLTTAVGVNLDL